MRSLWPTLTAICIAGTTLEAQTCPAPVAPATYVGSFTATYSEGICSATSKKKDFEWGVCVWRTGSGEIEYTIAAGSITATSECGGVSELSATQIFDIIATQTVYRGISRGDLSNPSDCSLPANTTITYPSCVWRNTAGNQISFSACGAGLTRQQFEFCSTNGVVATTDMGNNGSECSWPAEPTGNLGGWILQ